MKRKKQFMAGVLSAAILLNGTMIMAPSAFADDDDTVAIVRPALNSKQVVADWLKLIIIHTSAIADKDLGDLQNELAAGKTLVQASGLDKGQLSSRLLQMADQAASYATASASASSEEINSLYENIRSKTVEALSVAGYKGTDAKGFDFEEALNTRMGSLVASASMLSDDDYVDVQERLKDGGSLAYATGLSQSQLLQNLLLPLVQQIQQAADNGSISSADAAKYREQAEQEVKAGIQNPSGIVVRESRGTLNSNFDGAALLKKRAASIIQDASLFTAEYDAHELKDAVEHGNNLLEATGLTSAELISDLEGLWWKDIEDAYRNGSISEKVRDELKEQASLDIHAAIHAAN